MLLSALRVASVTVHWQSARLALMTFITFMLERCCQGAVPYIDLREGAGAGVSRTDLSPVRGAERVSYTYTFIAFEAA